MNLLEEGKKNGWVIETTGTRKITIDGHTEIYKVYKVRLDKLFYNDKNDRIATWISQYKADVHTENIDMNNMEEYNNIIQEFIVKSNPEAIKKTQVNIQLVDQREAGVILVDGRIIDGNRRFTCLRNLARENTRFNYFETVILEKSLENNSKQIKMLELMIQHGEESKVEYNPIDRLVGIYNDIIDNGLLTVKEYAMSTNMTEQDLNKQIEIAKLLVEFLETINAPKQFYMAREMELNGPLHELYGILKKVKNEDEAEKIKYAVFTNFLMQPHGDMTRFIRKIKSIASSQYLQGYLTEQMNIAERVIDKLPEIGKVDKNILNEIRKDEEIKEELKRSLDKAETKVKSNETRTRPLQILEKVGDLLDGLDKNIFMKLNEEQRSSILSQVDKLDGMLNEIKAEINV